MKQVQDKKGSKEIVFKTMVRAINKTDNCGVKSREDLLVFIRLLQLDPQT
jgi:hypothetical protein